MNSLSGDNCRLYEKKRDKSKISVGDLAQVIDGVSPAVRTQPNNRLDGVE